MGESKPPAHPPARLCCAVLYALQFVGISPFGTDAFLRNRLRAHLQQIKQDDVEIENEGLENLTEEELRAVGGRVDGRAGVPCARGG